MKSRLVASVTLATLLVAFALAITPTSVFACKTLTQIGCNVTDPNLKCCQDQNLTCQVSSATPTGKCVSNSTPPPAPGTITLTNPLGGTSDIRSLIERFATILRDFATPVAILMILFGAFRILTAAGDSAKFETGKKILMYTAIGYAIIFLGWGITSIIESLLSS